RELTSLCRPPRRGGPPQSKDSIPDRGGPAKPWAHEQIRRRLLSKTLARLAHLSFNHTQEFSSKAIFTARAKTATFEREPAAFYPATFMDTDWAGRGVLVTGASGGIGGEVVRAFVREGARVVAHHATHPERALALAAELGPACIPLGADLTREDEVRRL